MGYSKMVIFAKSIRSLTMIKKTILLLSFVSFFVHAGCTSFDKISTQPAYDSENRLEVLNGKYKLSPPDVIEIVVSDNPELSTRSIIRPDGNTFIPLIGDIYVEGLTSLEARKKVHQLLGRYLKGLPEESISVQILGFNSKRVYVYGYGSGMVALPFTGELTVLDAVTQSGFLVSYANEKKIKVVRGESDPGKKPQSLVLNMNDIVKKGRTENNIVLRPNDVVYIPPTILGRIGLAIQDVLFPTQPLQELGGTAASAEYNALGFGATRVGTTDRNRRGGSGRDF
ncbi:MAG: polysaccharide biosynthesis/export family protein [Planctomycetota bacterium]|jgi:polysaccharide export outer membrane protein